MLRLVAAFAVFVAIPAAAREISANEAGRAAAAWVRRDNAPLGAAIRSSDVAEVRTQKEGDTPLFHMVRMTGGGMGVTSAESGVTPVVAFLDGGDIQEEKGNPLWEILTADMSNRLARVRAVREGSLTGLTRLTGLKDGGVFSNQNLVNPVNPLHDQPLGLGACCGVPAPWPAIQSQRHNPPAPRLRPSPIL